MLLVVLSRSHASILWHIRDIRKDRKTWASLEVKITFIDVRFICRWNLLTEEENIGELVVLYDVSVSIFVVF